MAVNKVIYGSNTLIDISDTTATADKILSGYTAYGADGNKITGSASGGAAIIQDTQDTAGGTIRSITTKSEVYLQEKTITPTSSSQTVTPDTGYDGFSSVTVNPPNLTTKTGSASEYTEVVTPYTVLRTVSVWSNPSTHTVSFSSGYTGYQADLVPQQVLSGNAEYKIVGVVEIFDSQQILETHNIDTSIIWKNTGYNNLLDDNSSEYLYIGIQSYSNPSTSLSCMFGLRFLKAGTYGFRFKFNICEPTTSYDGLKSAIIEQTPYSDAFMKDFIGRTTNLKSFVFPDGIKTIGDYAFAGCYHLNIDSLPNTITSIGSYAFYNCQDLSLTSLPDSITSINQYAFQYCYYLALTSLPSGLTIIESSTFRGCSRLALTSLPNGVTTINSYAFSQCTSLPLTSLPNSITKIYSYAFQNCQNLALTSLPNTIDTIDSYCFENCHKLAILTIPSSVTKINSYAFRYCESITSILCEGAITTLGTGAFNGSSSHPMSLVSARFPNMALTSQISTVFGSSTAANACQLLELVDIGESTGIASNAFANCYSLQTLILRKTTVASLAGTNAFTNTPMSGYNNLTGTVYVPSDLIASYKTATNWSTLYTNGTIDFEAIEGSEYELS